MPRAIPSRMEYGAAMLFAATLFTVVFVGCQTAHQRRVSVLADRVQKLKPLSSYKATWCRVEAQLTEPARARYQQMFPEESARANQDVAFTWKARESTCEVTALDRSALTSNYKGFLDTALCVLLQTHWVNSPFDEFPYAPERLSDKDGKVHLAIAEGKDLGLTLDPVAFDVETRTKGRGTMLASYAQTDGEWLPTRLEQRTTTGLQIVLDDFVWDSNRIDSRRLPRSLWIAVGEERPIQHSQLKFSECREY
ncbi:MAG: hypothetical protein KF799_14380 [Bdellovibrionales bacterium]|nr:hypothetical protein [Bdellovibrionales bacterium]